jgi:lysylphosphatidylglycerol synthetase-like protein (DUF2156 family)
MMFDTWVWRMVVNFSYVFAAIFAVLILAKSMGGLEKALQGGDAKAAKLSMVLMGICSLGVGYAIASFFGTFLSFPNLFIKVLIIGSMGVIIYSSSKRYIEKIVRRQKVPAK